MADIKTTSGNVQIEEGSFSAPSSKSEGGLSSVLFEILGHGVTVLELILAICTVVFFVIIIGVGAGLGGELQKARAQSTENAQICNDVSCRISSGVMSSYMNSSANPCEDFQEYACGGYFKRNKFFPPDREKTVYSSLYDRNKEKIENLLQVPISDYGDQSNERKVKQFFSTCVNDYQSNKMRGKPVLEMLGQATENKVWLLDGSRSSIPSFGSFNRILRKVHIDFWTDAFFTFFLTPNAFNRNYWNIQIQRAGLGMWAYDYIRPRRNVTEHYKKYMKTVLSLLMRDNGQTPDDARIDQFWNDTYTVEYQLANLTIYSKPPDKHPHLESELKTVRELTTKATQIDFVKFFQNDMMFGPSVTPETKVILMSEDYVYNVNSYIDKLVQKKGNTVASRLLTNYMSWRLIQKYATYLSYDYIHANREYYEDRTGRSGFLGNYEFCFRLTNNVMHHALGSLFVQDHFSDGAKVKVESMVQSMTKELIRELPQRDWMDQATREAAIDKLNTINVKVGYPQSALNKTFINDIYKEFRVSTESFFGNIMFYNDYVRNRWAFLWKSKTVDKNVWRYRLYDVHASVYNPWHEIMVPAGMLQWPLFSDSMPHYINYGSMGTIMAHELINSIDEIGGYYTGKGEYIDWWSNKTTYAYLPRRQCIVDFYANMTAGPYFISRWNRWLSVSMKRAASSYARFAIAETGGLRYAFNAYKQWVAKNGQEKQLPGIQMSNEKAFFVSYAQTNCFNRDPFWSFIYANRGSFPEDLRGNGAVHQYAGFAKVFNCPAASKLNTATRCNVF